MSDTRRTPMELLSEEFTTALGCCLHEPVWQPKDVEIILMFRQMRGDCAESETRAIVRLRDPIAAAGTKPWALRRDYGYFISGEDTSGHGCQCGSSTLRAGTLQELVRLIPEHELEALFARVDTREEY